MTTKKENRNNALMTSVFFAVLIAVLSALSACSSEFALTPDEEENTPTIHEVIYESEKTLYVTTVNRDSLSHGVVQFSQDGSLTNQKNNFFKQVAPKAKIDVVLKKDSSVIAKGVSPEVTLSGKSEVKKQTSVTGDKVSTTLTQNFKFSDGQEADVKVTFDNQFHAASGDTIVFPHVVIEPVTFSNEVIEPLDGATELRVPYKHTLVFKAIYTPVGISEAASAKEVSASPWYYTIEKENPEVIQKVSQTGRFIGCPVTSYEVTETIETNKRTFTEKHNVPVVLSMKTPETREMTSLDKNFANKSTGNLVSETISEVKNENGFTIKTVSGSYTSKNIGKENQTTVENIVTFSYQIPTKFESQYTDKIYPIEDLKLSFEEVNFSQNGDKKIKTINTVSPKFGNCTMDSFDEVVILNFSEVKPEKSDSSFIAERVGNKYIVKKIIKWSDNSSTSDEVTYTGKPTIKAVAFGDIISKNLNWNNETLKVTTTNSETSQVTTEIGTFKVVKTTKEWKSVATNGSETGVFAFITTDEKVTFTATAKDYKYDFADTGYNLNASSTKPSANSTEIVVNGKKFIAHEYNLTANVSLNGENAGTTVSEGRILLETAPEVIDSSFVAERIGNQYLVTKLTKWSDGSTTTNEVRYTATPTMKAVAFGDVITSNLNWNNETLRATSENSETSQVNTELGTFSVVKTTKKWSSVATNGSETGVFAFQTMDEKVTFTAKDYKYDFADTGYNLNAGQAVISQESSKEGEYIVHTYALTATASLNGENVGNLTSTGRILLKDNIGKPVYTPGGFWTDDTYTCQITKRTPHSSGKDEVEVFEKDFTVILGQLTDSQLYAKNAKFSTSESFDGSRLNTKTDEHWTIKEYKDSYRYTTTNGQTKREHYVDVISAEVIYDDGDFSYTWNLRLSLDYKADMTENPIKVDNTGNYDVYKSTLELTAKTQDNHVLTTKGSTNILVKK